MRVITIAAGLMACGGDSDPSGSELLDTGWFTESTGIHGTNCPNKLAETVPEAGNDTWYWRDRPSVFVSAVAPNAYDAWLVNSKGVRFVTTMEWDETGLSFDLDWDGYLEARTDYTLFVRDCARTHEIPFTTSELGEPLDVDPGSLIGNTYLVDLVGATWVEPPQLASVLALYFNSPVLLAIQYADAERIDLLGALGIVDAQSGIVQDPLSPSWNFPVADFSQSPFIDAEAEQIVLQTTSPDGESIDVPIHGFRLEATLSPDGTRLGGGRLSGMGDTRNLGAMLNADNPDALCELAAGLDVSCEPCPNDGFPYCMFVSAVSVEGLLVDSLVLTEK